MQMRKSRHDRTTEGCRETRRPTDEERRRYADAQARAMLSRMWPRV